MNTKKVFVDGEVYIIDSDRKKLYDYSNKDKVVKYDAEIIEDGRPTGFWTEFEECGTVDSIDDRLKTWNNPVRLAYASAVGFDAPKNDKDGRLWNKVVEYVKANETTFFTKDGDWKKVVGFNVKNGQIELRRRGGAREGSGRKPAEVKKSTWSAKVTEDEKKALKAELARIRGLK